MKRTPPFSPASEVCGTVVEIGEDVDGFAVGDKVFGAEISGGLAELTRVPSHTCYKLPDGVDPTLAAGFELNYGTSWHGIVDVAKLQEGETMLVLGASGGVGMAAIDIGRALGANVVACASTTAKLQACVEQGANRTINYSDADGTSFKQKLKAAGIYGGIDVVFDPVGGGVSEPAMRALGWGGRFLVIGFAAGGENPKEAIPNLPINLALLNERQIQGVFWGAWKMRDGNVQNKKNVLEMLRLIQEKKMSPTVSKIFPLSQCVEAFRMIMERKAIGKIVVQVNGNSPL